MNAYPPTKAESYLTHGRQQTIFWQQSEEIGEAAIVVTTDAGVVEIMQEGRSININAGTVPELIKTLRAYAAISLEETK